MSNPIPLRPDFGAPHLRQLARESRNANQVRRLLALAAIYDGATRTEAAEIGGVVGDPQRDQRYEQRDDAQAGTVSLRNSSILLTT